MSDDELHALEKTLDVEYDDPFQEVEACMEASEFLQKIQENKEKLIALFTDSELNDAQCKTLVTILPKASKVEGISLDGVNISPTGLGLSIAAMKKHGKIKHVNLGGLTMPDNVVKLLADFLETSASLESFNISYCEFSMAAVKALMEALKKNYSLTNIICTAEDENVVKQIDLIMERNKKAKQNALVQQQKLQAAAATATASAAAPAVSKAAAPASNKMITLWFKGEVHVGETPPSEPGWTRFTFDAGTTFSGGEKPSTRPMSPPPANLPPALTINTLPTKTSAGPLSPPTSPPAAKLPSSPPPPTAASVKQVMSPTSAKATANTATDAAKPAGAKILFRCQALYTYQAQDADEASFSKGDIVEITKRIDEDWFIGRVESTGKTGQVPANHLKILK